MWRGASCRLNPPTPGTCCRVGLAACASLCSYFSFFPSLLILQGEAGPAAPLFLFKLLFYFFLQGEVGRLREKLAAAERGLAESHNIKER